MAANNRTISASIRFLFDISSMPQARMQIAKLSAAAEGLQGALNKVNEMSMRLDETAGGLRDFADRVLQPMQDAAQNFVGYVGATNSVGQAWLKTSLQLEQAQLRIGKAAATALQPMQQAIADITSKTAEFIEQHPELLRFAASTAGIAAGAAMVLSAGSQLAGILSSGAQQLLNAARFLGTSKLGIAGLALGAGAAGGFFGAKALAGAAAGAGIISQKDAAAIQQQKATDVFVTAVKLFAMTIAEFAKIANQFAEIITKLGGSDLLKFIDQGFLGGTLQKTGLTGTQGGLQNVYKDIYGTIDKFIADFDKTINGTGSTGNQGRILQDQILYGFQGFLQQMQQAQAQYEMQVSQQTKQFLDQQAQEQTNFSRQEQQQIDDFNLEQQKGKEEFYRQELLRQVDFQKQQKRAEEDHRRSLQDAAARLDALAVLQEMRQHTTDTKRANEDFKNETQRNKEEFSRQEGLARENFQRQLDRQRGEFRIQQAQARAAFNIQMKQAQEQYQLQLKQQSDSFRLQLQQQNAAMFGMEQRSQQFWTTLASQLNAFMAGGSIPSGTSTSYGGGGITTGGTTTTSSVRSRALASGGYANTGDRVHGGEFVLTRGVTSALERMNGRPLSQGGVLAMAGGGGINAPITMMFNDVGAKTPGQLAAEVTPAVEKALTKILRRYNKS